MKWKSIIVLIIIVILTGCKGDDSKVEQILSPEKTIEQYFIYWNEKNDTKMDSLVIEDKRGAKFNLEDLLSVTLNSYTEREDKGNWNENWYNDPYEYTCVDVSFTIEFKDGAGGGFENGTYEWQYYLVKETENSHWIIVMWGV